MTRQAVLVYLQFWVGLPVTVVPERSEGGSGDWHAQGESNPSCQDENLES